MEKIRIELDELLTDDSYSIYVVRKVAWDSNAWINPPIHPTIGDTGVFYYLDNLDEWVEENADTIEIVNDYINRD